MRGLQIWTAVNCRSVMAFYECLAKSFGVPLRVLCDDMGQDRAALGWDMSEYGHLDICQAGRSFVERMKQFEEHADWGQWFAEYQGNANNRKMMVVAKQRGCLVGVSSESPSNGVKPSLKRIVKDSPLFWHFTAHRCRDAIAAASFVANYSGDETVGLRRIGWPEEKIIPFGYYPRGMVGIRLRERTEMDWRNFSILVTGAMDWRRGQDDVIEAISILKKWGYAPRVVITQKGELYEAIRRRVQKESLNVDLAGFAEYGQLLDYYSGCSVFVASGRCEPWGMRINDALNAGAPIVVSRGMGGHKIVNESACGCTYCSGDALDLAWQLKRLMDSKECYLELAGRVRDAVATNSPECRAQWLVDTIRARYPEWRD